ncbi:uncharacterized protein LACBIDRAFT_322644 [Laccaria bicolor S238N-H82]|uniref:Predicted protein n=1 Tax=Laccaria bicolor (strain S238N-H82 / ATCC MYA-4686) TaxID=486041 RepID=B0CX16_LACBS|nr:uncharacterized protein LACBIDRAFT_322644 [Laccaria bicolor S238N-H82]EDR13599.1 predicted protein [Laccaria bicolor S238N-H82]|eukprot:XP_001876097.1 predicted protein [Laccaria bicolor S238N-H82]
MVDSGALKAAVTLRKPEEITRRQHAQQDESTWLARRSVNGGNVIMSGVSFRDMLRHLRRRGFSGRVDSGAIEGRVRTVRKRALKGRPERILYTSINLPDALLTFSRRPHLGARKAILTRPTQTSFQADDLTRRTHEANVCKEGWHAGGYKLSPSGLPLR